MPLNPTNQPLSADAEGFLQNSAYERSHSAVVSTGLSIAIPRCAYHCTVKILEWWTPM